MNATRDRSFVTINLLCTYMKPMLPLLYSCFHGKMEGSQGPCFHALAAEQREELLEPPCRATVGVVWTAPGKVLRVLRLDKWQDKVKGGLLITPSHNA